MLQSVILSGIPEIAPYDPAIPFDSRNFRDIGNVSTLTFNYDVEQRRLPNSRTGRGNYATADRVNEINGQLDARNLNPQNLALGMWGAANAVAGGAVADEEHVFHGAGTFVMTVRMIDTSVAPVVEVGATTVATADYVVERTGIRFKDTVTTAGLVADADITISYTASSVIDLEALVTSAPQVSVRRIGEDAVSGEPITARVYKVKFGLAGDIALIGDDFATLSLSMTIEEDATIIDSGLSKFLKLQQLGEAA
jgi:hypothetical protein